MLVVRRCWLRIKCIERGGEATVTLEPGGAGALQGGQDSNLQRRQQTAGKQRQAARWALRRHLLLRRCFHGQSLWSVLRLMLLLSQ
ncbi:hypothetical protein BN2497_7769 [Janthinobacterium sp. CG23_2]|nr:hypothetical protein BN2497_7769 [Janthinobacterium sp. CG23_2]CUU30282.1 hypothetical protein BN3177_7769 [Janthinobacterium sp. CG23_2]